MQQVKPKVIGYLQTVSHGGYRSTYPQHKTSMIMISKSELHRTGLKPRFRLVYEK